MSNLNDLHVPMAILVVALLASLVVLGFSPPLKGNQSHELLGGHHATR